MPILSALDCISPAFGRTKLVLFSPFRKGRTWKLAATSWLAVYGAVFFPFPLIFLVFLPEMRREPGSAAIVAGVLAVSAVFTVLYLAVFYLLSRLRFAFFDIVLNRGEFVAPAWRKYGSQSLKWTLCKVLLGSFFMGAIAFPVIHIGKGVFADFSKLQVQPGAPPSPEMMQAFFSFYAAFLLIYLFVGVFYFASSLLADFVVPSLALEDTTLAEAFRRVGVLLRNEPGQVFLYAVLKFGLVLVGAMAVGIAFYIAMLIVVIAAVIVGGIIGLVLYLLHVPTAVLTALGIFFGAVIYMGFIFYGMMLANGTLFTFIESYTLYFLSGRYPLLGELLAASTPPPAPRGPLYPEPYPAYVPPPAS